MKASSEKATIERIVVHHTAFEQDDLQIAHDAISRSHMQRWTKWWVSLTEAVTSSWSYMMYHRLIWKDWSSTWDRSFDQLWWWTKTNNINTFHISLVGNFNNHPPSEEQYKKLNEMITYIRSQYWDIPVYGHGQLEWEATSCPGSMFDYSKLVQIEKKETIFSVPVSPPTPAETKPQPKKTTVALAEPNWEITFSLTRYYSPMQWQSRYYNNKTYEQDVTINCWASAIWNNWCLYPASGIEYTNAHKNNSVACPSRFKIGTKIALDINGEDHIVTCQDRWWAIQNNRLDMYCWVWEYALDNWSTCITWNIKWRVIS